MEVSKLERSTETKEYAPENMSVQSAKSSVMNPPRFSFSIEEHWENIPAILETLNSPGKATSFRRAQFANIYEASTASGVTMQVKSSEASLSQPQNEKHAFEMLKLAGSSTDARDAQPLNTPSKEMLPDVSRAARSRERSLTQFENM